jgi:D-alanyl-D-alanine carboxypeptidase/D-alanyl-D-alanine-endopeptidase (penicillin-binding protein 4)
MTPASLQKLLVTSVSLLKYGPDYKYQTPLSYSGKLKKGKVKGNLYITGSGDPSLSARFYHGSIDELLGYWADSLQAHGVHKINGNLIIIDTLYSVQPRGSGWQIDDLAYDYAAERSSFVFNENHLFLIISGVTEGAKAEISVGPGQKGWKLVNEVITSGVKGKSDIEIMPLESERGWKLTGFIRLGENDVEWVAIPAAQQYAAAQILNFFKDRGIKIRGKAVVETNPANLRNHDLHLIFRQESLPMRDIVRFTNKSSLNLYAEMLLLKLAGDEASSIAMLRDSLLSMGIQPDSIRIADGSGLSRYNLNTPDSFSKVLLFMANHKEFVDFIRSMPVAGKDGSLKNRMQATPAEGKVFAKTGSMRFVRNLSGYAITKNWQWVTVTIMINNYPDDKAMRAFQDKLCALLADLVL